MAGESFKKTRSEQTPEAKAYHEGVLEGQKIGIIEGRTQERGLLLDLLEKRYLKPDVKRGEPVATAILQIARELGQYYRDHPLDGGA